MKDFDYDVMQKKRLASMAKYRKRGSKSRQCSLPSDNLTKKQWKERCGEVHSYTMNEPKSWAQFKEMPVEIQSEYLKYLIQNYNANATSLAAMFGVRPLSVRRHVDNNQLGVTFKVGNSMTADQRVKWNEFIGNMQGTGNESVKQDIPAKESSDDTEEQTISGMECMHMEQFSLTFQGKIDANMIANSILSIVGEKAVGKIEIICTL